MRIKKSVYDSDMIGFFVDDENGYPEEFLSVYNIKKAQEIVNQLQKDLDKLKKHKSLRK